MKLASEKQMSYANAISHLLQIPLPTEKTAQAYFLFIDENKVAFESARSRRWLRIQEKKEQEENERLKKFRAKEDAKYEAFLKRQAKEESFSDEFSGLGSISTW